MSCTQPHNRTPTKLHRRRRRPAPAWASRREIRVRARTDAPQAPPPRGLGAPFQSAGERGSAPDVRLFLRRRRTLDDRVGARRHPSSRWARAPVRSVRADALAIGHDPAGLAPPGPKLVHAAPFPPPPLPPVSGQSWRRALVREPTLPPSWREPVAKATLSGRPTTAGRDPPGVTPRPRGRVPGSGRGCDDGEGTGTERVAVAPALQRGPAVADVRLLQADGNRGAGRAGHGRIVGAVPDPRRGPCAGRPRLYRRRGAFATWSTRACG